MASAKCKTLLAALFLFFVWHAHAQEITPERDNNVYPKTKPDAEEVKKQMEAGSATLTGRAYSYEDKKPVIKALRRKVFVSNGPVWLLPYDTYMEEWIRLKMKKENPRKKIFARMDQSVWDLRRTALTNSDGDFTFSKLKPGKYVAFVFFNWENKITYKGPGGFRSAKVFDRDDFLYEVIEIPENTDNVKANVELQKIYSNVKIDEYSL